jgi:Tfp pilus assembly protein PilF
MYEDLPTLWDTTLKRNPDSILALNNRGYAFMRDGKLDAASRDFEKALTVNPDYEEGHNNLGTVLLEKGSINAALDHFETAIRIRPTYVDPYVNRGRAHFELGAVAEAVADFKKAIELAPNDANAHYNLGAIYRQEGRVADAIAELTKSSQIRSGADVYYQLGAAYRQAGRTKESIDELRQALAIDPAFQDAREELAIALFETDQTEAGARELRDVLIARPQDSLRILNNVTWSLATGPHANEKTAEIALTLADRARAAGAPNDPLLLRAMAAAYARLGRFSDAVSTIHKALSSTPTSSDLAKTLHEELQQYEQGAHHRN